MNDIEASRKAIIRAADKVGGPVALSRLLGLRDPTIVSAWIYRGQVSAAMVLKVEALTGVSRHDLRSDIFGKRQRARARA
jgi:DNA-binding transcriptional regulator YdaS (Cro superfamily)